MTFSGETRPAAGTRFGFAVPVVSQNQAYNISQVIAMID